MAEKRLISVDELRAAGALDVPPSWRKSLGGKRDAPALFDKHSDAEDVEASTDESDDEGDDQEENA